MLLLVESLHAGAAVPLSQAVTLDQPVRARDEVLTLSIMNPPADVKEDQRWVRLERDGQTFVIAAQYLAPDKEHDRGTVSVQLTPPPEASAAAGAHAPELPLGDYTVVAELNDTPYPPAQKLKIAPPGNPSVHLEPFSPATADHTARAFFSDSMDVISKAAKAEPVVSVALRGAGFQTGNHSSDNRILINNIAQDIEWGDCSKPDLGGAGSPVPRRVIAQAVSSSELDLCRLTVPANGQILIRAGLGDDFTEPQLFRVFSLGKWAVTVRAAIIALALALLPLLLLSFLPRGSRIEHQSYKLRLLFLDPETDTYSLSKLQFYLWTVAALFGYAYLFISKVFVQNGDWPDIPGTLPGIIAIAAGTSVSSQFITVSKGSKGSGPIYPGFADLITSGGVVAPDRVQMLLWTFFGVGAFIVSIVHLYPGTVDSLPTIPDGLMYLMGLSSAGYLGGKLARKAGPVINEIDIAPPDPDEVVISVADQGPPPAGPNLTAAINSATTGMSALQQPANASAIAAIGAVSKAIAAASTAQTLANFDNLLITLAQLRSTAEQAATQASQDYSQASQEARTAAAQDANTAQSAAALLQDFSADITSAIAVAAAAAAPLQPPPGPGLSTRTIILRGTNLSSEALLEIDNLDFPYRMLVNSDGKQLPDVLIRDDSDPQMARALRFTIDPSRLAEQDLVQLRKWFTAKGQHTFTLTNPDGQAAELGFSLPPGTAQK
jgi:hypothetical protein